MATLPDDARIGRVALSVGDLARATSFYADAVGLAIRRKDDDVTVLGTGGADLLALRAAPDAPERPTDAAGLFHVAFRYPSRGALAAALARVRESWRLTGASDHLVSEALYLDDPEGNGVELYRDRPREEWERTPDGGVRLDTRPLDLNDLASARDDQGVTGDPAIAAGGTDAAAPPGTDVGHVHLEATDLDRARAFYVDALGFEATFRASGALFVSAGGYHHHVGLNVWNRRAAPASGRGLDWFEVTLQDDALAAAVERLESAGYAVERTDEGATASDPDGIEVRLVQE